MKCYNPQKINEYTVPCGHCYACKTNLRNAWDFRLRTEARKALSAFFCTLTYNADNEQKEFNYKHIQLLNKKLRNKGYHFKFYCIGERGTLNNRIHWHMLFFLDTDVSNITWYGMLQTLWSFGFVDSSPVSNANIHYVTKWHCQPKSEHGVSRCSKGIGIDIIHLLDPRNFPLYFYDDGVRLPVARYYRKKLGVSAESVAMPLFEYVHKYKHMDDIFSIGAFVEHMKEVYDNKNFQPRNKNQL